MVWDGATVHKSEERPLIGSWAGATCFVEYRPVLNHFKLWRETTLTINLNA